MAYDENEKFTQPVDGIVFLGAGPSNEELDEIERRVAQGEGRPRVIAEIEGRVELRNQQYRDRLADEAGNTGEIV